AAPRRRTGVVAGQARAAHVGPRRIDRARRRNADLSGERRAAIAVAAHFRARIVDINCGDRRERGIALQREARPLGRMRAAGAARLACCLVERHHGTWTRYFSSISSSIGTPPSASSAPSLASASPATAGAAASASVLMPRAGPLFGSYTLRGAKPLRPRGGGAFGITNTVSQAGQTIGSLPRS